MLRSRSKDLLVRFEERSSVRIPILRNVQVERNKQVIHRQPPRTNQYPSVTLLHFKPFNQEEGNICIKKEMDSKERNRLGDIG
ncbi:hypothetical protein TNCV_4607581 [Trichonephila clavipes]|nr:hypothetical protein TNCV_4607581 [Trichonephila clavipes]